MTPREEIIRLSDHIGHITGLVDLLNESAENGNEAEHTMKEKVRFLKEATERLPIAVNEFIGELKLGDEPITLDGLQEQIRAIGKKFQLLFTLLSNMKQYELEDKQHSALYESAKIQILDVSGYLAVHTKKIQVQTIQFVQQSNTSKT